MNKIDLTPLVGSQVLMQFEDNKSLVSKPFKTVGFLCGIHKIADFFLCAETDDLFLYAETDSDHAFDSCRIYQHPAYWISNVNRNVIIPNGLACAAMYVSFEGERYVQYGVTKNDQFFIDGKSEVGSQLSNAEHIKVIGPAEGWSYE